MAKKESKIKKIGRSRGSINIDGVSIQAPKRQTGRGFIEYDKYNTKDWTTKKYFFAVLIISVPYVAMLFALYSAGLTVLVAILIGITILCALLVSLAYWLDKENL